MSDSPPSPAGDCTVVIFGATGDLARRKLLPALVNLAGRGALPERFAVLGVGRTPMTDEAYREKIASSFSELGSGAADPALWAWLEPRLFYAFETLDTIASYESLSDRLDALDGAAGRRHRPPVLSRNASGRDGRHRPASGRRRTAERSSRQPGGAWSSRSRSATTSLRRWSSTGSWRSDLAETQIYRIDHYLGKETVQNILALRFGNGLFEPVWNRRYIDHVQITVAETVGVEDRGGYYDRAGALRDMVQNHLFQLLALTAMEPPISFSAEAVRDERVKVLHAIHPLHGGQRARGCRARTVRPGHVPGRAVSRATGPNRKCNPDRQRRPTSPSASSIDNWRFAGVPFYLRTGKRLPARVSEIAIQFNRPPLQLFEQAGAGGLEPNLLLVRIQPNEGISLQFQAKVPGADVRLGTVTMAFNYADYFARTPETGYETLLYDCMTGDQTLFHRADMVAAGWRAVAPILDVVGAKPDELLHEYPACSWGPAAADALLTRDGRAWRRPEP